MNPPPAGRIAAVDYGRKRVGIALSDPLRLFARPVGAFSPRAALDFLTTIRDTDGLSLVVLGWPLDQDGNEGAAVEMVRPFLKRIEALLPQTPIVLQDERYTSEEAKSRIHAAGRWQQARHDKGQIDAEAACVLLEDYLAAR